MLMTAVIGLSACNKNEEQEPKIALGPGAATELMVDATGTAFTTIQVDTAELTYTVLCDSPWEVDAGAEWIEISDVTSESFTLSFKPNVDNTQWASDYVWVMSGVEAIKIYVSQAPINHFQIGTTIYPIDYAVLESHGSSPTGNRLGRLQFVSGDITIDADNSWHAVGDHQYLNFYVTSLSSTGPLGLGYRTTYRYQPGDYKNNDKHTFDNDSYMYSSSSGESTLIKSGQLGSHRWLPEIHWVSFTGIEFESGPRMVRGNYRGELKIIENGTPK